MMGGIQTHPSTCLKPSQRWQPPHSQREGTQHPSPLMTHPASRPGITWKHL